MTDESHSLTYSGKCRLCGEQFVGMSETEYNRVVSRHIIDHNPDDPDMVVVVRTDKEGENAE